MKPKLAKLLGNAWTHKLLIIVVIVVVMGIVQPKFFMGSNINSILLAISIYGIMACGMLVVIIVGGIDFCIGSTAALGASICTIVYLNFGATTGAFFLGLALALAACLALGLFHGVLAAYLRLQPFVVTMGTQYLVYGIVLWLTGANYIIPPSRGIFYNISNVKLLGIPMPIIWFAVFAVVTVFVLSFTPFGRKCYFAGGNREAAEIVGINSKRYMVIAFVLSSFTACIGGIILASLNMQASASTASGYENKVLTAMVVGGCIGGDSVNMPGVIFGALFVGILNNALILLDVSTEYTTFVQGIVILGAIAVNVFTQSLGRRLMDRSKTKDGRLPDTAGRAA